MADKVGRKLDQRKADVLAALNKQADLWLATADKSGHAHLIAISAWWNGSNVIVATTRGSRTARNLESTGAARLAIGTPDDVIVMDASLGTRQARAVGTGTGEWICRGGRLGSSGDQ